VSALIKPVLSPLRVGRVTGSRVGAILGLNPYSKRSDVMREMVREHFGADREFTGNEATRHGEMKEPEALAKYEALAGEMTYGGGAIILHPIHDFLAVTPDGLIGDGMIECKAPFRGDYTHWNQKPYYEAQMRLQMECAGRKWCDFVVLQRDGEIHVSRIKHDQNWIVQVMPILKGFIDDYNQTLSCDESFAPHLQDKERSDKQWESAASDYLDTLAAFNDIEKILQNKRQSLIDLAGDLSTKGAGVHVIRSERAGSVSYAKAIKDLAPMADLAAYTSKPSVVFTVKEIKQ